MSDTRDYTSQLERFSRFLRSVSLRPDIKAVLTRGTLIVMVSKD